MPGISDPGYELYHRLHREPVLPSSQFRDQLQLITQPCVFSRSSYGSCSCSRASSPLKDSSREGKADPAAARAAHHYSHTKLPTGSSKTLGDLSEAFSPDRKIALGRELTKRFEEYWYGTLESALTHYEENPPKGEFTPGGSRLRTCRVQSFLRTR